MTQKVKLKDLKRGEMFKRKDGAKTVYTRGEYDRTEQRYECNDWDDISRSIYLKGDTLVVVGFTF